MESGIRELSSNSGLVYWEKDEPISSSKQAMDYITWQTALDDSKFRRKSTPNSKVWIRGQETTPLSIKIKCSWRKLQLAQTFFVFNFLTSFKKFVISVVHTPGYLTCVEVARDPHKAWKPNYLRRCNEIGLTNR